MNKRLLFLGILTTLLCVFSCGKEETSPKTVAENHNSLKKDLNIFLAKKDRFVTGSLAIANSSTDIDFIREVHSNVSSSLSLGLDEIFYLNEIGNENKKINKNINRHLLQSSINNNITKTGNTLKASRGSINGAQEIWDIMGNDDYNIYWPYSENWNGSEAPAIVFLDEKNENNLDVAALLPIKENGHIRYDTIIVNEGYAEKHPVWILSKKSDLPYENIPQLADGNRSKNGTYFLPVNNSDPKILSKGVRTKANSVSSDKRVYTMRLGEFMAEKHYDPWLRGGSEFYFLFTETATNTSAPSASGLGMSTQINRIFVDRPRKTIKNKNWVNVNQIAVSHWRPEVFKSALVIIEKDTDTWEPKDKEAEKINFDIPITYIENGKEKTTSLKGSFTIHKDDELITTKNYDRNFIFSNGNNLGAQGWYKFSEAGLHWKLPTYIYTSNI